MSYNNFAETILLNFYKITITHCNFNKLTIISYIHKKNKYTSET